MVIIMSTGYKYGSVFLKEIDALAEKRKNSIIFGKEKVECCGKRYYVSENGDDNNSGLSPEEPWKTLVKVNEFDYSYGDYVLFKRNDVFRGQLRLKNGVSYSSYGSGNKPKIFGSPENGADPEKWRLEDADHNIWVFYRNLLDVGTIVFNDGEECAYKSLPNFVDGNYVVRDSPDKKIYDYHEELSKDLMFFSKCDTEIENGVPKKFAQGKLYLKCDRGNPGKVFNSIEFNTRKNIIEGAFAQDVLVDNLCIKYGGSHGVGAGCVKNLTVSNCEIGWIGGGILYYDKKNEAVRYGNAVEVYTECDGYYVKNNYIYQCYDSGITHQQSPIGGDGVFRNVVYSGNLIEKCIWSIEYYFGNPDPKTVKRLMTNIIIEDNILRCAGEGFGSQRLNGNYAAHIMSWWFHENNAENFVIRNNIFDRSTHCILQINAAEKKSLPILCNNKYLQNKGGYFGRCGLLFNGRKYDEMQRVYDERIIEIITDTDPDNKSEVYYL